MESEPRKLRVRRFKKPKTFKEKFIGFFGNQHVESSWEINVLITLIIVFATALILFLAMEPSTLFDFGNKGDEKKIIFKKD